jgi:hypothetical protein
VNYALPQKGARDTERFRARLYALYRRYVDSAHDYEHAKALHLQTGAKIASLDTGGYDIARFFEWGEIADVLSFITIVYRRFGHGHPRCNQWLENARKIFREENILFVLDDQCGVHPKVDEEFQRSIRVAMVALEGPQFAAAKVAFESAYNKLGADPPDYTGAIRNLFESVETVFQLKFDGKELLDANINTLLTQAVQRKYARSDPATIQSAARFLESFRKWVIAAYPYRHGQPTEVPTTPPDELAFAQFTTGAGFLRWLTTV